jgi:hypothetical protein
VVSHRLELKPDWAGLFYLERVELDERKPIDAVPAMALAVWRATQAVAVEPFAMAW